MMLRDTQSFETWPEPENKSADDVMLMRGAAPFIRLPAKSQTEGIQKLRDACALYMSVKATQRLERIDKLTDQVARDFWNALQMKDLSTGKLAAWDNLSPTLLEKQKWLAVAREVATKMVDGVA